MRRADRRTHPVRPGIALVGLTAIALVALGVVPPGAASFLAIDHAPFTGATLVAMNGSAVVRLGYNHLCFSHFAVPPFANASTGAAGAAVNVSARAVWGSGVCKVWGNTTAGLRATAFTASSSGTVTVLENWSVTWSAGSRGTGFVRLEAIGNLFDSTTHSWLLPTNRTLVIYQAGSPQDWPHAPSNGSAKNQSVTLAFTVSVVKGHHLLFFAVIHATTSALGVYRPGCAYGCVIKKGGDARADFGPGGAGTILRTVTIR